MTGWLTWQTVRRAPRRILLGAVGAAFPVALLAATLFFIDDAARQMVPVVLQPVQVEMRALATSPTENMSAVSRRLAHVRGVARVEPFGGVDVLVHARGGAGSWSARLFAVRPAYLRESPWLHTVDGRLAGGAMLDQSLRDVVRVGGASSLVVTLPGDGPRVALHIPVQGSVDLRDATTWFSIPSGEVQGDLVTLPRALVVDYSWFSHRLLPVLQRWSAQGGLPPFDPGSDQLPPVSLEAHVSIDHATYPPDPASAAAWSDRLRRDLERQGSGAVLVADNALEPLTEGQTDATNAKILFLLLGVPGVLLAGALALAVSSALAEAHRREEALLRLRGATRRQVVYVAVAEVGVSGLVGVVVGLTAAVASVSVLLGRPLWVGAPAGRLVAWCLLALAVAVATTLLRLAQISRAERQADVARQRQVMAPRWRPLWLRYWLDVLLIVIGVAILTFKISTGGLRPEPVEGSLFALSFFVLMAPIALWVGLTLLAVRASVGVVAHGGGARRRQYLTSWWRTGLRWFGRRPARTASALALGVLAVAFATEVVTFTATYAAARHAETQAEMGSDLRLTPGDPAAAPPKLGSGVAAVTPIRIVPARVGSDRKTILTVDLSSYGGATTSHPIIDSGSGLGALAENPLGVVVTPEVARDYSVSPGDKLPLTVFPDDFENSTKLVLDVVGVARSFPPTAPFAEMAMSTAALPPAVVVPPDFYLARVQPGVSPGAVGSSLLAGPLAGTYDVSSSATGVPRGLTALDLGGLSAIASLGGILVAAAGVAVLIAFLVAERRRELAVLRSLGADTRHVITPTAVEGGLVVVGQLGFGIPLGLLLGALAVRVLRLFFSLPPAWLTVPRWPLVGLVLVVSVASTVAAGIALLPVIRIQPARVLREQ